MDDEDLGKIQMTAAFPFLSETPAEIRHAGPSKGKHNEEILCGELNLELEDLKNLKEQGVI
jgi:formyl-CoA transferase